MKSCYLSRIFVFVQLFFSLSLFSQSACTNADFEMGNFTNWTGQTGTCCPINTGANGLSTAPVNSATGTGRHVIMTGNGTDPNTCGNVPVVAPGSIYSARLGNSSVNNQAERLRYVFNITPQTNLIIYKYAVILEDPGHTAADQPRFEAKLLNQNGQVVPCTYYQVVASSNAQGFQSCNVGGSTIRYQNWVTIGVDASSLMGQNVTLDFATGDCDQGAHYGYAYVDAGCAPFNIESRYCDNPNGLNTAFLSAPQGFAGYQWSTGQTGSTIMVANPSAGQIVSCTITSVNGCQAVLSAILTPSQINTDFTGTDVCDGGTIDLTNTTTIQNGTIASYVWTSSDGYTSNATNFTHQFTAPGTYNVKLKTISDLGCKDSVTRQVRVYANPIASLDSMNSCVGDLSTLTATSTVSDAQNLNHTWIINSTDTLTGNVVNPSFSFADTMSLTLICKTDFGCADTTDGSVIIYPNPVSNFSFIEKCIYDPVTFTNTSTIVNSNPNYQWFLNGNPTVSSTDFTTLLPNVGTNTVSLVAFDTYPGVTCDDTSTLTLIAHDIPYISIAVDSTICEDINFNALASSSVSTGENASYIWLSGNNTISTDSTLTYQFNDAGTYPITVNATTDFGCINSTAFNMYISPTPPAPILSVTTPFCPGDPAFFSSQAENNSTIYWSGPNNFSSSQSEFEMPLEINQMGTYSAYIISEFGCQSLPNSVSASIANIYGFNDFPFPNVITANGDGINDELNLNSYFQTCDEYTITFMNRWGNVVFIQTNTSTDYFDGETLEDKELKEGVYFYKLEFKSPLNSGIKHGFVHIVK